MKSLVVVAVFAVLMGALPAAAGPLGRDREQNQQQRIRDGVRSGELTRNEAEHLREQQQRVDARQHQARRDGVVTRREARRIDEAQDRANRSIARQKNDRGDRNDGRADRDGRGGHARSCR